MKILNIAIRDGDRKSGRQANVQMQTDRQMNVLKWENGTQM